MLKSLLAIIALIGLLAAHACLGLDTRRPALSAEDVTGRAKMTFAIPAWHEEQWFEASCCAAGVLMLWSLYRLRMQRVEARNRSRLEAQLGERMRIARELHDTLLQGMHGLLLRFQDVANRIPGDHPAAAPMEQALIRADAVLIEGRDAVRDLRQPTASEEPIGQVLAKLAHDLAANSTTRYRVFVEGVRRPLHPVVHEECARIATEAMRNAFRHSRAQEIEIDINCLRREFRLCIRDNGRGITEDILRRGRENHFGLRGMRERAARIGGSLLIWSQVNLGTEIELRISGGIAYRKRSTRTLPGLRGRRYMALEQ